MNTNFIIFLRCVLLLFVSFFLSNRINKLIIGLENKKNKGQEISIYLMDNHQQKKMTPTLGGIGIIISIIISSLFVFDSYLDVYFLLGILLIFGFFIIGTIDDLFKILFKNYLGLSPLIRFLLEILLVLIIYLILDKNTTIDYSFHINNKMFIPLGGMFMFGFIFLIVGSANSVNLTDGLDGLAGGIYLVSLMPFSLFLLNYNQIHLVYLLLMVYGSVLGFLVLNLHPARIFMGDSGSLALGSFLGYIALVSKKELLLLIIGGIFVFETLSVIIQVTYFKFTHKRIFKMAPFHHHLEIMGKKEYQIVMLFYVIAFTLSLLGLIIGFTL